MPRLKPCAAREQLDAAQKQEARLRQAIQIHMGEAGKATFACGGSVTWRRSKDGQVFNTAQFVKDHPELAKAYLTTRLDLGGFASMKRER
jgi:hypothetical protein